MLFILGCFSFLSFAEEIKQSELHSESEKNEDNILKKIEKEVELKKLKLEQELLPLKNKKTKLELEKGLRDLDFNIRLENLNEEKTKLEFENNILRQQFEKKIVDLMQAKKILELENSMKKEQLEESLSLLLHEKEKIKLENEMIALKNKKILDDLNLKRSKMQFELQELKLETEKYRTTLDELSINLDLRSKTEIWKQETNRVVQHVKEAFSDGLLKITDRRIELNGPLIYGTGEYVTERIHFFNNMSHEFPIFLVINYSPGGSVMEGYRILKAMEASEAPIYVVVKSFAASMAAVIATMGDQSFAYQNAIILHHQPSSWNIGNLREQIEYVEIFQEWAKRLHGPVAEKMGVSLEVFYNQMYEKSSTGDWQEFADQAILVKWIDHVVDQIQEQGIIKEPQSKSPYQLLQHRAYTKMTNKTTSESHLEKQTDVIKLPQLKPFDMYMLYNQDERFVW